jgi:hypothetical protein
VPEERMDERSILAYISDGDTHSLAKMDHIIRDEVGQISILGVIPEHLDWVEFRRIAGKPFHLEPVYACFLQEANSLTVRAIAIQHQNQLSSQVTVQEIEKGHDLFETDVVIMHLKVQPQSMPKGSHGDGRDDRETVVPIPTVLDWRLAFGCPSAADHRLEHKAAFVYQNDAP